jgi:uncharacterized membrane protein
VLSMAIGFVVLRRRHIPERTAQVLDPVPQPEPEP